MKLPNPGPVRFRLAFAVLWAAAGLVLSACAQDQAPAASAPAVDETAAAGTQAPVAPAGAIHAEGAWIRAMAPGAPVAGGFMAITNTGAVDDRLLGIATPDAARVEIHEMRHADGVMQMRHLDEGLPLAAGANVVLEPGGYHLMFIEPARTLVAGETVTATLRFERADPIEVVFQVMPLDATGPAEGHRGHP